MCLADFLFQGIVDGEESTTAELLEQVSCLSVSPVLRGVLRV